jgi:hypothetical protein
VSHFIISRRACAHREYFRGERLDHLACRVLAPAAVSPRSSQYGRMVLEVVDRCADAAAVNAITGGSHHTERGAINHRTVGSFRSWVNSDARASDNMLFDIEAR